MLQIIILFKIVHKNFFKEIMKGENTDWEVT